MCNCTALQLYIFVFLFNNFLKMETIELQILDNKALKLLRQLEDLQLVRIVRKHKKKEQTLSEKYAGKLPAEVANDAQKYLARSRDEWNRDI